jgi:hypothetical protein
MNAASATRARRDAQPLPLLPPATASLPHPCARAKAQKPLAHVSVPGRPEWQPPELARPFQVMTAKEQLRERIEALSEEEASKALRLLDLGSSSDAAGVAPYS